MLATEFSLSIVRAERTIRLAFFFVVSSSLSACEDSDSLFSSADSWLALSGFHIQKNKNREQPRRGEGQRVSSSSLFFAMPPRQTPASTSSSPSPSPSSSSSSLLAPGVAAKLALASAALVLLPALAWTAARAGKLDGEGGTTRFGRVSKHSKKQSSLLPHLSSPLSKTPND